VDKKKPALELTPKSWTPIQLKGVSFMSKYSIDFKTKVVHYHIEKGGGARSTAVHFGIDHSTVRKWYRAYQLHGALAFSKRSRNYTLEEKITILQRMDDENWSSRQASAFFNIPTRSTVQTWLKRYNEGGADALIHRRRGQPMHKHKRQSRPKKPMSAPEKPVAGMAPEELRQELAYLRAENAYLKKLDALVQEKRSASKRKH
jgi:transposase